MGDYTKLEKNDAKNILDLYGINEDFSLKALSLGISNSNYRIETKKKTYLLKVSNDKSATELEREQKLLKVLAENGYEFNITSYPTLEGKLIYHYETLHGVLFPFIEGIPPGASDSTCYEIGQGLGKLHSLTKDLKEVSQIRKYNEVGFGAKEIVEFVNSKMCPHDFKRLFKLCFEDELKGYIQNEKSHSLIHGDLYYDNTLFHNDRLKVILDFEQAGYGPCLFDIGVSISGSCLEKGRINPLLIESFMKGYNNFNKLEDSELSYLNDSILLGLFSIALWRIKRFKIGNLNPSMEDSYQDLLQKALLFKTRLLNE